MVKEKYLLNMEMYSKVYSKMVAPMMENILNSIEMEPMILKKLIKAAKKQ